MYNKIAANSNLFTHADPMIGFEQVFMDVVKDEVTITIGWDIWSGCFVTANDPKGGPWIQQIGNYLDGQNYKYSNERK
ncbi:hypothetical protein [Paenibacillus alba]|uniref:Uncharacterized protein n=1 Tax=Paenibacillus alba TaxID=1197127 RepID=A0ABU6G7P7_9BACL|nr:hypothetical protein [Paenibacillus alba]MEC0229995.1 hypothetical protein [Paenibacillus alba]